MSKNIEYSFFFKGVITTVACTLCDEHLYQKLPGWEDVCQKQSTPSTDNF